MTARLVTVTVKVGVAIRQHLGYGLWILLTYSLLGMMVYGGATSSTIIWFVASLCLMVNVIASVFWFYSKA